MERRSVVVVDACRSAVGRGGKGMLVHKRPDDYLSEVLRSLLDRNPKINPYMIEDVRIENLQVQKNRIRNAETAKLQTNEYVRGLAFVASPGGIQESANQVPEDTARKLADPQH